MQGGTGLRKNAIVLGDVRDEHIAAGVPARILSNRTADSTPPGSES
jgi:acetyltransferase-like isoleucine patch superfamily enzyme